MEGHSKLKIGGKEAHDTGDPWPRLEVERSKAKVTNQNSFSFEVIEASGTTVTTTYPLLYITPSLHLPHEHYAEPIPGGTVICPYYGVSRRIEMKPVRTQPSLVPQCDATGNLPIFQSWGTLPILRDNPNIHFSALKTISYFSSERTPGCGCNFALHKNHTQNLRSVSFR